MDRQYVHLNLCNCAVLFSALVPLAGVDPTSRGEQEETARVALSSFLSSAFQQVLSPLLQLSYYQRVSKLSCLHYSPRFSHHL